MTLDFYVRESSILAVRLALQHVRTLGGAEAIYRAERRGLNRPEVLRAAARRIEEFGGSQPERAPSFLDVTGEVIEKPTSRIVEAVGCGRRHPGW